MHNPQFCLSAKRPWFGSGESHSLYLGQPAPHLTTLAFWKPLKAIELPHTTDGPTFCAAVYWRKIHVMEWGPRKMFNSCNAELNLETIKDIFAFYDISHHWDGAGSRVPCWWKISTRLSCIAYVMVAYVQVLIKYHQRWFLRARLTMTYSCSLWLGVSSVHGARALLRCDRCSLCLVTALQHRVPAHLDLIY